MPCLQKKRANFQVFWGTLAEKLKVVISICKAFDGDSETENT